MLLDHRMSQHTGQVLTLAQHDAPVSGPAADPSIARSWRRCLQQHQLDPAHAGAPAVLEAARTLVHQHGPDALRATAKLHFKTTQQALA